MAYTNIDFPAEYFNTKLYTGNGSTQSITGVGFQPDWVWIKNRTAATAPVVYDAVRGATKDLYTSATDAEGTNVNGVTSFDSDGFSVGLSGGVNGNTQNIVAWNWLGANTTVSNNSGTITSTVSANTTAGFSIVSYTGTGANATVGHGLGVAPSMIITKVRSDAGNNWSVYHSSLGAGNVIWLNLTNASTSDSGFWNNTTPTSSVFSVGTQGDSNRSSKTIIAYCFADVKGYSKFGSYTGNGSTDGTFVYTGFTPAFVMIKRTDSANSWVMQDSKRPSYNPTSNYVYAQSSNAEATDIPTDLLSNGFKLRYSAGTATNGSGASYIYMAFASNPFVSSKGIPTTAR